MAAAMALGRNSLGYEMGQGMQPAILLNPLKIWQQLPPGAWTNG